jgi:hypothetical protein
VVGRTGDMMGEGEEERPEGAARPKDEQGVEGAHEYTSSSRRMAEVR